MYLLYLSKYQKTVKYVICCAVSAISNGVLCLQAI